MKNIALVGFMGTGKSSVGRTLAKRLKLEFVDIDHYIENREQRSIREIFEKDGEAHFRRLEKEAVSYWAAREGLVITTGGGTIVDPENYVALKNSAIMITLVARPETICERVKNSKHRPLLIGKEDLLEEIKALIEKRKPFYNRSDYYFDTDDKSAGQVVRLIQKVVGPKLH